MSNSVLEKLVRLLTDQIEKTSYYKPVVRLDRYIGSDTSYKPVVEWYPTGPKGGRLKQIIITSDANAKYRLIVAGDEQFVDKSLGATITLDMKNKRVPPGDEKQATRVFVKSTGPAITVDAIINADEEVPPEGSDD